MSSQKPQILETVEVNLHTEKGGQNYAIQIGHNLLDGAAAFLQPHLQRPEIAIITDSHVAQSHLPRLQAALEAADITAHVRVIAAGEASKNFAELQQLCDWLLDTKIERNDIIIALGGGVIGDLAGFASAILRRGTQFVQIPTTLLAQVDSAIGGKTAINTQAGKNLIGAFHQPCLVLSDMEVLASLPMRELRAGYAEIVKYGALGNIGFFNWLEKNGDKVLALENQPLAYAIAQSCRDKAAIVARDERESGERALLNLGHTFGHAFEKLCIPDRPVGHDGQLLHGEAVALGMVLAFDLSVALGHCPQADADRLRNVLAAAHLPVQMAELIEKNVSTGFAVDDLLAAMQQDKKMSAGVMRFILARGLGQSFIDEITPDIVRDFLIAQGAKTNGSQS